MANQTYANREFQKAEQQLITDAYLFAIRNLPVGVTGEFVGILARIYELGVNEQSQMPSYGNPTDFLDKLRERVHETE